MDFKRPKEMRAYFNKLISRGFTFRYDFDAYYLCMMAGLHFRKFGRSEGQGEGFIDNYPGEYSAAKGQIAALLIDAEIDRGKIGYDNREGIQQLSLSLLDAHSKTLLSDVGMTYLNRYAVGGLSEIMFQIPETWEFETFIVLYSRCFGE